MRKLFLLVAIIGLGGCAALKAQAKTDWVAVVNCARVDPANAAIKMAAASCVLSTFAGKETDCLAEFAPLASWTMAEVLCVAGATGGR